MEARNANHARRLAQAAQRKDYQARNPNHAAMGVAGRQIDRPPQKAQYGTPQAQQMQIQRKPENQPPMMQWPQGGPPDMSGGAMALPNYYGGGASAQPPMGGQQPFNPKFAGMGSGAMQQMPMPQYRDMSQNMGFDPRAQQMFQQGRGLQGMGQPTGQGLLSPMKWQPRR